MDKRDKFIVRFWGVRGSYPVPGPSTSRVGGNTSCVEVWAGGHLIIIDAGTGIIGLGKELVNEHLATRKPIVATILFSHTHHDHTQGFPFFEPAYFGTSVFYMLGPRILGHRAFYEDIEEALRGAMLAPSFPVTLDGLKSLRVISNLDEDEVVILDPGQEPRIWNIYRDEPVTSPMAVKISILNSMAHAGEGVSIYKITWSGKSMIYATDTEGYVGGDTRLIEFAKGADLLIHDAQYTQSEYVASPRPKQGWGHSTPEMATFTAKAAQVKKLVFFHHDPTHDDETLAEMERKAQQDFPNTILAYEGLTIEL